MRHARSIKLASPAESFAFPNDPRFSPKSGSRLKAEPAATRGESSRAIRASEPVQIFSDGACKGNPGRGGWGAVLRHRNREKEIFGGESETTNNRMELTAVIEALQTLKRRCHVIVHTDSKYVQLGVTEWLPGWIRNGWKTAAKKPVKNADLWQRLAEVAARHEIEWRWVRGHAGHAENERADQLANRGAEMVSASNETQ